jgi:hypothetical protein
MTAEWFAIATAGSHTGAAARDTDWEATALGPPAAWPSALRMAVELCLGTRFPVLVTWGSDLVMIYNDGYREMLGSEKHPLAMGTPVRDVWPEIWDTIGPLFDHVMHTGEPTWVVDQMLLMDRSGYEEEAYFTYSYSPLRDDDGVVRGVLDIATETTEHVVDRRRLRTLGELSLRVQLATDDVTDLARTVQAVLGANPDDVRAADLYIRTGDDRLPLLASTRGNQAGARSAVITPEVLQRVATDMQTFLADRVVVVPLGEARDRDAAGVLVLEANPRRPFDDGYQSFLQLIGSVIGTAIGATLRRAREVGELRRINETVQLSMVPDIGAIGSVHARYLPASGSLAVGGDWYDVVELHDGGLALLVGDCVGHGLDAAAVMGQLRSASRALLLDTRSAAATLEGLDRFAMSIEGAECTTVFCAIVDAAAHTVTYSSAGHLPPLLVGSDGAGWLDGARGVPLAVTSEPRPREEAAVAFRPGDTIFLFTDGLVERRGEALDEGLRRFASTALALVDRVPFDALPDALVDTMLPRGAADDVALLVHRAAADRQSTNS